jgi:thiol-disulfide isomerase/thioredoxin
LLLKLIDALNELSIESDEKQPDYYLLMGYLKLNYLYKTKFNSTSLSDKKIATRISQILSAIKKNFNKFVKVKDSIKSIEEMYQLYIENPEVYLLTMTSDNVKNEQIKITYRQQKNKEEDVTSIKILPSNNPNVYYNIYTDLYSHCITILLLLDDWKTEWVALLKIDEINIADKSQTVFIEEEIKDTYNGIVINKKINSITLNKTIWHNRLFDIIDKFLTQKTNTQLSLEEYHLLIKITLLVSTDMPLKAQLIKVFAKHQMDYKFLANLYTTLTDVQSTKLTLTQFTIPALLTTIVIGLVVGNQANKEIDTNIDANTSSQDTSSQDTSSPAPLSM